jgi:uncharacterized membrane protein
MIKLHPGIVHFPIALISIAAIFAVISLFSKKEFFKEVAFWNLLIGTLGAIVAVITGLIELKTLVHDDAIHTILEKHEFIGFAILILSLSLLTWFWIRKNKFGKKAYSVWVLFLVLGLAMVTYQGYLGGRMVFEKGAGVEPMESQLEKSAVSHSHSKSAHDHDTTSLNNTIPGEKQNMQPEAHHHHDTSSLKTNEPGKKQNIQPVAEHVHKEETVPANKQDVQPDTGHIHKKETFSVKKQDIPAVSEHVHNNKDSSASKVIVDSKKQEINSDPMHDHKNVQDTSSLKKTGPEKMQDSLIKGKKKVLKNMKY